MKKILSMIFALLFAFQVNPIVAKAAEVGNLEEIALYDELVESACRVFPEYSDRMLGKENIVYCQHSNDIIKEIICETRPIDDDSTLTYQEYSNGVIYLMQQDEGEIITDESHSIVDTSTSGGASTRTVDVKATCIFQNSRSQFGGTFRIKGLKYVLVQGQDDSIFDTGTVKCEGACYLLDSSFYNNENGNQDAYNSYNIQFSRAPNSPTFVTSTLKITVGNDRMNVSHIMDPK